MSFSLTEIKFYVNIWWKTKIDFTEISPIEEKKKLDRNKTKTNKYIQSKKKKKTT